MIFTPTQQKNLDQAIAIEIDTQSILARARRNAAKFIDEVFSNPKNAAAVSTTFLRTAIQFVSRPFRPIETALKFTQQKARQAKRTEPEAQQPIAASPPTTQTRRRSNALSPANIDLTTQSLLKPNIPLPPLL